MSQVLVACVQYQVWYKQVMIKGYFVTSLIEYCYNVDHPLQVCDSIVNIGPIADVTLGEPAFVSVSDHVIHHNNDHVIHHNNDHVIHCNVCIPSVTVCVLLSLNDSSLTDL